VFAYNYRFSIDKDTDPDGKFSVNSYGLITTAETLDRETQREHRIHVLATDKGKRAVETWLFCRKYLVKFREVHPLFEAKWICAVAVGVSEYCIFD